MKEIKISHKKCYCKDGSISQRGFKIDYKTFRDFFCYLQKSINKEKDPLKKIYLSAKFINAGDCVFMNLTQTDLFIDWVLNHTSIKMDKKRARLKTNGHLNICKN